jgi:hypothetical protein
MRLQVETINGRGNAWHKPNFATSPHSTSLHSRLPKCSAHSPYDVDAIAGDELNCTLACEDAAMDWPWSSTKPSLRHTPL